jgi:hypothetical protein
MFSCLIPDEKPHGGVRPDRTARKANFISVNLMRENVIDPTICKPKWCDIDNFGCGLIYYDLHPVFLPDCEKVLLYWRCYFLHFASLL